MGAPQNQNAAPNHGIHHHPHSNIIITSHRPARGGRCAKGLEVILAREGDAVDDGNLRPRKQSDPMPERREERFAGHGLVRDSARARQERCSNPGQSVMAQSDASC